MERGKFVIGWRAWANSQTLSQSARSQRNIVLKLWAKMNGKSFNETGIDALVSDILTDKLTIYESALNFLNAIGKDHKPSTVTLYRFLLPPFFKACLGKQNFDEEAFEQLVPSGKNYVSTTKKAPTMDEIRHLVELATPRDKALIGVLLSGMRPAEPLSLRMSDIQRREKGYARIKLIAERTKTKHKRFVFLTSEAVKWIDSYRSNMRDKYGRVIVSEWLFPGEKGAHLADNSAYNSLKRLFEAAGLKDSDDEIYYLKPQKQKAR